MNRRWSIHPWMLSRWSIRPWMFSTWSIRPWMLSRRWCVHPWILNRWSRLWKENGKELSVAQSLSNGAQRPLRKRAEACFCLGGICPLTTYCPDRSIQNICQKFKVLMGRPSPPAKIHPWLLEDRVRHRSHQAARTASWLSVVLTLSLPGTLLWSRLSLCLPNPQGPSRTLHPLQP